MTTPEQATVLLVDDERELIDLYEAWLEVTYDVRTATSGVEALDLVDDAIDVVLLDRNMPDRSGDEVLEAIRGRALGCRVSMVTALEPSFDVLELAFDDYLLKPVFRKELNETVDNLLALNEYDEAVQEYFALVAKLATIRSSLPTEKLETNESYARLQSRLQSIGRGAARELDAGDDAEFESAFKRLSRHWDVYSAATSAGAPTSP